MSVTRKNRQMSIKVAQKSLENYRFWHLYKNCLSMWEIWANKLLPKALKSCTKSKKLPNLATLVKIRQSGPSCICKHISNKINHAKTIPNRKRLSIFQPNQIKSQRSRVPRSSSWMGRSLWKKYHLTLIWAKWSSCPINWLLLCE